MISVEKFAQQSLPRQLGALAANLARIASCLRRPAPYEVVTPMMHESIQFIEWIAPLAEPEIASKLMDIQVMLALWRTSLSASPINSAQKALLSLQAQKWSEQVLDYSGLLDNS